MPKTVETRRHCEEHATIFRNPPTPICREGVAEDCCMLSILLAVLSCLNSFWHGVIPTSYFINDFYTHFFPKYGQDTDDSLASLAVRAC